MINYFLFFFLQLPSLNTIADHLLHEGQLVKFVGMIQDMFNPNIYFSKYEVKNTKTGETQVRHGEYHEIELEACWFIWNTFLL